MELLINLMDLLDPQFSLINSLQILPHFLEDLFLNQSFIKIIIFILILSIKTTIINAYDNVEI